MRVHLLALVLGVSAAMGASPAIEAIRLYNQGLRAERAGHFDQAAVLYSRAATLDPSNPMYRLRSEAAASVAAPPKPPAPTPLEGIEPMNLRGIQRDLRPPPQLQPKPDLQEFNLRGDANVLFEKVAQAYGLECVFDGDYKAGNPIHFELRPAGYSEALQALEAATGSFVVALSPKIFLVAKDTAAKRKEFEPYEAVTISIPQATSVQEMNEIAHAVQQTLAIEKVGMDTARNLFIIRGPISQVEPAQVLFEDLLHHHSGVSVEMNLVEVSNQDMVAYGLSLPNNFTATSAQTASNVAVNLADIARLGLRGWVFGLGVAQAQAMAQLSQSKGNTLIHLEMQASDGLPATFHLGEKYPILTSGYFGGTSTTGTATTGTGTSTTGTTQTPSTFGSVVNPTGLAVGDFNEDTIADFAAAANGADQVAVLLGVGDGTFGTAATFATGKTPTAIATADLNGDGHLDLVTADSASNTISVLLGNGDGTFQDAVQIPVGTSPMALAIADFDHDGHLDIAIANAGSNNISILLGAGDGTFQAAATLAAGTAPRALTVSDFNGDGFPDLAVVNSTSNDLWIYLGVGDGTFREVATYATGTTPIDVAAGQLNSTDTNVDLTVANAASNTISVFLGDGTGGFLNNGQFQTGVTPSALKVGDVNSDGLADIATVNAGDGTMTLLLGLGTGTFQAPIVYGVGSSPRAITGGDFNRDGFPDLLVANFSSNDFSILLGTGNAAFHDSGGNNYSATGGTSYTPPPAFTFEDLGLSFKVTPHIHGMDGISLDIDAAFKVLTGTSVNGMPVIANRSLISQVNLEEGEWAMVAGLLNSSDSKALSGIPGLQQIPALGHLFRTDTRNKDDTQLLILIKTHLTSLPANEFTNRPVALGSDTRPFIPK